ncbi:MAG: DsbA family oxidoreductase [Candidatus Izemoplasma sp.]
MKIELWSDFACPFCYIGKKRFENALNKFPHKDQVEVIYKAYQLNPNAPKEMVGNAAESFAKGHGTTVTGAEEKFKMFTTNALTVGLDYRYDIIQLTNTFDAHRVAKWAGTLGQEALVTERFMKAYFSEGANLADYSVLLKLVKELGLDVKACEEVLANNQFTDQVNNEITEAREVGVQGVPFFVLNRKYAVSGAQGEEYFTQVLDQLWSEVKPLDEIDGADEGHVCNDDSCSV